MSEQRDWPDYAVKDWTEMQRDNAIYAADMDEDLRRVTDEQVEQFERSIIFGGGRRGGKTEEIRAKSERSAALNKAIEAWRMK